ncbi:MAG: formimidoylglutamase [Propionivibrio sp.]
MWQPADQTLWLGHIDSEEGELGVRWHQRVQPLLTGGQAEQTPGNVLIGFACDAGVVRNHGRAGAAGGPAAVRKLLVNCAWHQTHPVYDGGNVQCKGDALEAAQFVLGTHVATMLEAGHLPLVIGGGHEVAWGSWQGLATWATKLPPQRIGVLNFDAHFDLRAGESGTSGTPFRQISEDCAARGWPFRYACFGVARPTNTAALFTRAQKLGVCWVEDDHLAPWHLDAAREKLAAFLDQVNVLHLTIDLDVLPAANAPGVSAPAVRGVELAVLEALIDQAVASGKVRLAEFAEFNPNFDIDGCTARIVVRLLERIARGAWAVRSENQ